MSRLPQDRTCAKALASLRRRLQDRRRTQVVELPIGGASRALRIFAPANPDSVLDELSALLIAEAAGGDGGLAQPGPEQHMPYWATPWASGMALAEAVLSDPGPFRGRRSLELGCGLGVTAIAAAQATAHLTVADCFAEALAYCRLNVMQNAGADVHSLLADWRLPAGRALLERAGPFDVILAADVLYEPADVEPLLRMVPRLLRRDGVFWLAEPGRATSAAFVTAAQHEGWREMGSAVYQRDWPAGAGRARVVVRRYSTT